MESDGPERHQGSQENQRCRFADKDLAEPPLDYGKPTDTAAYGDLGEDEAKRERRIRAEARKKKGKKGLKDYIPWL